MCKTVGGVESGFSGNGGERIEGNLFVRCGYFGKGSFGTVFVHGGHSNVVRNCVFVDCERPLGSKFWDDERWGAFVLRAQSDTVPSASAEIKTVERSVAESVENP